MVLLVVVYHVSVAYSSAAPIWYVMDSDRSLFFDLLFAVLDVFMMPVLFFIAGYFALHSQRQKTMGVFIAAKLKRLGIPWLFGAVFLVPVLCYFYFYSRTTTPLSFWTFWQDFLKSMGDLQIVFIDYNLYDVNFMNNYTNYMNHFSPRYLWFISLLLFFFIGFALLYQIKSQFFGSNSRQNAEKTSTHSIWIALFIAGIVISLSTTFINSFFSEFAWVDIYNLLTFQVSRFPVYLVLFVLGIYAYSKNWFTKHELPGSVVAWFIACVILLLIFLGIFYYIFETYIEANNPIPFELNLIFGFVRAFLVIAFLVFLNSFACRYWNRATKMEQNLAANSYAIYIIHMPIVVIFQFAFLSVNISIFLKFGIIVLLSILVSYGISHCLSLVFQTFRRV